MLEPAFAFEDVAIFVYKSNRRGVGLLKSSISSGLHEDNERRAKKLCKSSDAELELRTGVITVRYFTYL